MTRVPLSVAMVLLVPALGLAASPTRVAPPGDYDQFALAADIDANNGAVLGWTNLRGGPHPEVATRTENGRFGSPIRLGTGRMLAVAQGPRALGATAVWRDGTSFRTARRAANGAWITASLPSPPGGSSERVAGIDVDRAGRAVIAIESRDGARWIVRASSRDLDGRWNTDAQDLVVNDAAAAQAGVDGDGGVTAAWVSIGDDRRQSVRVSSRNLDGQWSTPRPIFTAQKGSSLAEPRVVTGPRGDVAVLMSQTTAAGVVGGGRLALRSASSTRWLMTRSTPASSMAIGARGAVWAGWLEGSGRRRVVVASRLDADGTWAPREQVRGPVRSQTIVGGPGVAVDGTGRPVLWWVVDAATGADTWYSSSRRPSGGWVAPTAWARTNGSISVTAGATDALALWVQGAGGAVVVTSLGQ